MIIKRVREFAAAHRLTGFPEDHKCYNMHGHNWRVEVSCAGEVDSDTGCVVDFGKIDQIIDELDHCYLNDVDGLGIPTCENVSIWIFRHLADALTCEVRSVKVWETDNGCAIYKGESDG